METTVPAPADSPLSLRIRSGRKTAEVTAKLMVLMCSVPSLCERLGLDVQTAERICGAVRASLSDVFTLRSDERIVFCDCDAQFCGVCRSPDRVTDNVCNSDTPLLKLPPIPQPDDGREKMYHFPVGGLRGANGAREPGTPLKIGGQRVEIGLAKVTSLKPDVAVPATADLSTSVEDAAWGASV